MKSKKNRKKPKTPIGKMRPENRGRVRSDATCPYRPRMGLEGLTPPDGFRRHKEKRKHKSRKKSSWLPLKGNDSSKRMICLFKWSHAEYVDAGDNSIVLFQSPCLETHGLGRVLGTGKRHIEMRKMNNQAPSGRSHPPLYYCICSCPYGKVEFNYSIKPAPGMDYVKDTSSAYNVVTTKRRKRMNQVIVKRRRKVRSHSDPFLPMLEEPPFLSKMYPEIQPPALISPKFEKRLTIKSSPLPLNHHRENKEKDAPSPATKVSSLTSPCSYSQTPCFFEKDPSIGYEDNGDPTGNHYPAALTQHMKLDQVIDTFLDPSTLFSGPSHHIYNGRFLFKPTFVNPFPYSSNQPKREVFLFAIMYGHQYSVKSEKRKIVVSEKERQKNAQEGNKGVGRFVKNFISKTGIGGLLGGGKKGTKKKGIKKKRNKRGDTSGRRKNKNKRPSSRRGKGSNNKKDYHKSKSGCLSGNEEEYAEELEVLQEMETEVMERKGVTRIQFWTTCLDSFYSFGNHTVPSQSSSYEINKNEKTSGTKKRRKSGKKKNILKPVKILQQRGRSVSGKISLDNITKQKLRKGKEADGRPGSRGSRKRRKSKKGRKALRPITPDSGEKGKHKRKSPKGKLIGSPSWGGRNTRKSNSGRGGGGIDLGPLSLKLKVRKGEISNLGESDSNKKKNKRSSRRGRTGKERPRSRQIVVTVDHNREEKVIVRREKDRNELVGRPRRKSLGTKKVPDVVKDLRRAHGRKKNGARAQ